MNNLLCIASLKMKRGFKSFFICPMAPCQCRTLFFFDQIGQFVMCHGPLRAKFNAEYRFRLSQGVHTGYSSRLSPHGFLLRW